MKFSFLVSVILFSGAKLYFIHLGAFLMRSFDFR